MSEFDKGFGDVDSDRGEEILHQFHNAMYSQYAEYDISFEDLKKKYNPAVIEALGLAANSSNMTSGATNRAMIALAEAGQGRIPGNYSGFFNALQGQAAKIDYWQAFKETVTGTAKDLEQGFEAGGGAIIEAGKAVVSVANYSKYFLWAGIAFAVWAIYQNRDQVGKALADKVSGK